MELVIGYSSRKYLRSLNSGHKNTEGCDDSDECRIIRNLGHLVLLEIIEPKRLRWTGRVARMD